MDTREFTPHTYGSLPGERCDLRSRLVDDAPKPTTTRPASKPAPTKSHAATPTTASAAAAPKPDAPKPTAKRGDDTPPAKPSPKASGDAPHAAATDSTRGAAGAGATATKPKSKPTPTDTSGDSREAHKAAAHAPAAGTPTTSAADSYVAQLEARAKQAKLDQQRDAATIDAAVSPEERTRLQAEQDAFQGIDRSKAGSGGGPVQLPKDPKGPAAPTDDAPAGRRTPGTSGHAEPPNAAAPSASESGGGASGGLGGAISSAIGGPRATVDHTQEQWVEFLRGRDYWVGDDGEVWRVEVGDDGSAALYRNDDPDGEVRPPRIGTSAAGPVASGKAAPTQSGSDEPHGAAPAGDDHPGEHDHGFELPEAPTAEQQVQEILTPTDDATADPLPPADRRSASGATYLLADNRTVTSVQREEHWDVGIDRTSITRAAIGDDLDQMGSERLITTRATRPDGSRAIITTGGAVGSYVEPTERGDNDGDVSGLGVSSFATSTVIDADGTRHSTDSRRPSPRPTPTTIEELRATQDELGTAYAAASGELERPTDPLDGVFHDARTKMARIDADELQRAAQEGARNIAKDDPDAMTDYADSTFADVRAKYAEFGLDAAAGNEEIDRTWLSDDSDVASNAYYSHVTDSMKFGKLEDGTPFSASDDVIAHEFAHRITEKNGGVTYQGESGAINESLSDTMAAAIDTEDWLVGEDIKPGGIRDMSEQHTMSDFKETESDHGGVHTNSAIPNYAAYLIGDEVGRDEMGRIYARTMDQYLSPDMQFTDLARGTWRAAVDLYGENSREAAAVREAWDGVLELNGATDIYEQSGVGEGGGGGSASGW